MTGDDIRRKEGGTTQITPDETAADGPVRPRSLPKGLYAHFLLVDIASPVREIRGIPRYLPVKESPTFLGRNEKVQILLDDPWTVDLWHARLDLCEEEGKTSFVIYPVEKSRIAVNGEIVEKDGFLLQSEDVVQIGSARLVFFQRNLNAAAGKRS